MRHLPRALNRFLLFLIGLIMAAIGVTVALLPLLPQLREYWAKYLQIARDWYYQTGNMYRINGTISWFEVAWIALAAFIIIFMLVWIFKQGGGKTDDVAQLDSKSTTGSVTAEANLVNQVLQRELADERLIGSITTSAWKVKGKIGVRIRVVTAKGADIAQIRRDVTAAVARIDSVFGKELPVLLHITSGWMQRKPARTD